MSGNGSSPPIEAESTLDILEELGPLRINLTAESRHWESFERYMAGGNPKSAAGSNDERSMPKLVMEAEERTSSLYPTAALSYVDRRIVAMMELVEAVTAMDGDLWQAITAPMSLGLTDILIRHKDEGVQKEYQEFFEFANIEQVVEDMWLGCEAYGNVYPLESWSADLLEGVLLPNPKHMIVMPTASVGERILLYAPPKDVGTAISKDLLIHNTMAFPGWNERAEGVFQFNQDDIFHVHHFKFAHQLYALPPLARAGRAISTRMMLEEMIRSTIEGIKNQIILYRLENPQRGERQLLESKLRATRSARIQHLVWTANLDIEHITPEAIDPLLATETWWRLTLDVFRKIGVNVRMLSGEVAGSGSPGRDFELDIQLYLERQKVPRRRMSRWLQRVAKRYAKLNNIKEPPYVGLKEIDIQVQNRIKNKLQLLMQYGFPSAETIFEELGMVFDVEIARLEKEWGTGIRKLLQPYVGFAQTTDNGDGEKKTESPLSPGRPPGKSSNNGKGDNAPDDADA